VPHRNVAVVVVEHDREPRNRRGRLKAIDHASIEAIDPAAVRIEGTSLAALADSIFEYPVEERGCGTKLIYDQAFRERQGSSRR
jgi:hypothetical protein